MKNVINVMMVDSDSSIKEVKKYFEGLSSTNVNIKYAINNGMDAIDIIKNKNDFDIILMDLVLEKIDGIGVLKTIKENNIDKKVIIYSNFNNNMLMNMLSMFDVSIYLHKSTLMNILEERINDAYKLSYQGVKFNVPKQNKVELDMIVSKMLHDLGMPSHIKGYSYIRESIMYLYENPEKIHGITKDVYPYIANMFNTTSSRVERAIRHAIEVSWTRGDYDLMEEIFGNSVDFDRAKPTNSEFLATVADRIALNERNKSVFMNR